jgi:Flp pilus assembly protein TadG
VTSLHRIRNAALLERLRHFRQDQRGDALIEFAISVTVMLTMVFGVMDFSRAVYVYHFLPYAAGQGIRYAAVRGSTWGSTTCTGTATLDCAATSANITSYVQSIAPPGVTASTLTVTTTWPGTTPSGSACISTNGVNSPNCLVKVSVSCPFSFVLPFLPSTALTFAASSEQIILE